MEFAFKETLLKTQIEIQEETLKNISQEIHDNIGQVLTLVKLNLNTMKSDEVVKFENTKMLVGKAINDLRDLSRSMHGDKIAEIGLHESILYELAFLKGTEQYQTHVTTSGNSYRLSKEKEMVLFRIFQECINNIIKHSNAKTISICFYYGPSEFSINITDDGNGFSVEKLNELKTGIGLKSMNNRAILIGGFFSVESSLGNGTTIKIIVNKQ